MKIIEIIDKITCEQIAEAIIVNGVETFNEEDFFKVFQEILNNYDIITTVSKLTSFKVKEDGTGTLFTTSTLIFKTTDEELAVKYDEKIFDANIIDKIGISGYLFNSIFRGILSKQLKILDAKRYILKGILDKYSYSNPQYIEDILGLIKAEHSEEIYKIAVKISEMEF